MKTWGEIKKKLEDLKSYLEQAKIDENYWAEDRPKEWIECLEWVLDLEVKTEEDIIPPFDWNSVPVRSMEEIKKDMEDFLMSPSSFFKYLKEKSNENRD